VAVGRAIVRKPQVFLFDEPLSNLDAKLRVQMRAELKKLHERLQATIVYVTHDQVEAMTMGDRIVIMKDGSMQQVGDPLGVYERPANQFVAGFIGSPAMNFLRVGVAAGAGGMVLEGPGFRLPVPAEHAPRVEPFRGQRLTLGIRPEDLRPAGPGDPAEGVIEAPITVVEPLGSDQFLELDLTGTPVIARLDTHLRVRAHDRIRLVAAPGKIHLFDPATERAILA
jgi:multiple sugar transport system ATP-binding protein